MSESELNYFKLKDVFNLLLNGRTLHDDTVIHLLYDGIKANGENRCKNTIVIYFRDDILESPVSKPLSNQRAVVHI